MNEATFNILKIVVTLCAAIITAYVVPYINTLRSDARYSAMLNMVSIAVRAAEQQLTGAGTGKEKKLRVMQFVGNWMRKQGVNVTEEQLSELVEAAVYSMKEEKVQ